MENEIKIIDKLPIERWEEFKNLRIEAHKNDPNSFSSDTEETINQTEEEWKKKLDGKSGNRWVFAEDNGKLVGAGFIYFYTKPRFKHNASLQGLYVSSEYRRRGIGEMLVNKRIEIISEKAEVKNIICDVYGSQVASLELHKKLGFEEVGRIKDFAYIDDSYFDMIHLVKYIK